MKGQGLRSVEEMKATCQPHSLTLLKALKEVEKR